MDLVKTAEDAGCHADRPPHPFRYCHAARLCVRAPASPARRCPAAAIGAVHWTMCCASARAVCRPSVSSLLCVTLRTDHSHNAEAKSLVESISKKEEGRHARRGTALQNVCKVMLVLCPSMAHCAARGVEARAHSHACRGLRRTWHRARVGVLDGVSWRWCTRRPQCVRAYLSLAAAVVFGAS